MDYLDQLAVELTTDPLAVGYSAMSDEEAAASLNTKTARDEDVPSLTGDEIFNAADPGEFSALTAANKNLFMAFCGRPTVDPFAANNVAFIIDLFGNPSQTRTNLIALRTQTIQASRADDLGLPVITAGDVQFSRGL